MATFKYAQATITVSNVQPGQKISVQLTPQSGQQTVWSAGNPAQVSAYGINLNSTSGLALPIQSFTVTAQTITILSSSSSGSASSLTFTLSTYLAATDSVNYVSLSTSSDPGVVVQFAFTGQKPVTLSQAPVMLTWPSS